MNNTVCTIPLTQGKFTIVSPEDFEWLLQWKWYARKYKTTFGFGFHAWRGDGGRNGKTHTSMHRELARRIFQEFDEAKDVDHSDRNGLNNQRENLRQATFAQTRQNSSKPAGKSSQYKGVSWFKAGQKWMAYIKVNRKKIHLGYFFSEVEAALAYDAAARKYFGEFACTNF